MKNLFVSIILVLFVAGCIPSKGGNTSTTDVLVDTITQCLGSAVETGLSKDSLESCISSTKGNLTELAIGKLKSVLSSKFSSDTLTKLLNLFFGTPDDNAIIPDNDADKISTILIKIEGLKK